MAKKLKKKNSKSVTKPAARLKQLVSSLYTMAHELPVYGDWLDDVEIEKIENDPVVLSSISKRKAATLKKEMIVRASHDAVATELTRIIDYTFRSQVLDTVLQGMSVFELNWQQKDGYWYPVPVERDYRAFSMLEDKLIYEFEEVDPRKVLQITHRAKFNAPLADRFIAPCFGLDGLRHPLWNSGSSSWSASASRGSWARPMRTKMRWHGSSMRCSAAMSLS